MHFVEKAMEYTKRPRYQPVPSVEGASSPPSTPPRSRTWISHVLCVAVSIVVTFAFMSMWMSIYWPTIQLKQTTQRQCGRNVDEAKAAGCIFDGMMNHWVSEACYDKELTEEFLAIQDWIYYEDYNATIPITQEQLSRSEIAYGTWEWHEAHCFYSMLKLQRAISSGRQIQLEVVSEEHTRHCKMVVNTTNYLYDKAQKGGDLFDPKGMGTILHPGIPLCINSMNLIPYSGVVVDK